MLTLAAALLLSPISTPVELASSPAPLHGTLLTPESDTRAAAGPVSEGFFEKENVHCANVSAGRTKQAFVLLSQKVLANIRTALHEG